MKYLKFTYIDSITGVSVAAEPALNGTKFPGVVGLEFVWARESAYPTPVPEFFGTCPDASDTDTLGVIGVFVESDWEQMRLDEINARSLVPKQVTMRQARLALLGAGLLSGVATAIAALPSPQKEAATVEWEYSQTVERHRGFVLLLGAALGLDDAQLDTLFVTASGL